MKLEFLYLDGYKGLKDLKISFSKQNSPVSIDFFVGQNGSGKSSLLEAIGLIFTRIIQNELPGFPFEIRYSMSDGARITVRPKGADGENKRQRLFVEIRKDDKVTCYEKLPDQYLPDRIISYCSGVNNSMEEILLSSPRASLASDLYDLSIMNVIDERPYKEEDAEELYLERERILGYYEQLEVKPRSLFLDAETSKFILPVLFGILPFELEEKDKLMCYLEQRRKLIQRLNMKLIPIAFSIQVRDEMLENAGVYPQRNLLLQLVEHKDGKEVSLNDWTVQKTSTQRVNQDGTIATVTTVVFRYLLYDNKWEQSYYHPKLQQFFGGNPFMLLITLLSAYRDGIIKEISFFYRDGEDKGLYGTEALSDGELMWMARTGLILLAQSHCGKDTLFLYDEPDVHFNDDWNKDFIKAIYQLRGETQHAFFIATHSTLILTDARNEQLHLLWNEPGGRIKVIDNDISTFAAQRDEIAKQIFGAGAIGSYAQDSVDNMIKETDIEKIIENIAQVGPGYERFRMYEQLYDIIDKTRN